ncbi:MAG TPA: glycerophosphodiester phosphodiesterase [Actinomycetes bacterium]|nr:glycerophosphodiester phosphodiesterase [Actinomycetes bacterium]
MASDAPHRVRVVAHRGASAEAPEHTLAAYRRALEAGADGLECDVRLTADGHLVCVHDRTVDRTSDGRGVVSTLELAQLDELDFGAWRDGFEPPADPAYADRRRVLTLERLLELVADAGRPVEVAIETKHPTRYAGLVERRVVEVLDRFGWAHPRLGNPSPVRVMSFSWLSLRRMRSLAPSVAVVYLMERVPLRLRDGTLPAGVRIAGPSIDVVRAHPHYVERARSHGNEVHVWTVDDPDDVRRCLDLGVDAIITNRPADVLRELAAR